MSTRRLIQSTVILLTITLSYLIGYLAYQYLNDPVRLHQGVWNGNGQIVFGDMTVESDVTLIIERNGARLSIDNRYKEFNYTYDVNLSYKKLNHERNHLDITQRSVNGLEEFIESTSIQIPSFGTLVSIDAWQLEKDELFLNIQMVNGNNASFIMVREDEI
jgi:hypothetical protein